MKAGLNAWSSGWRSVAVVVAVGGLVAFDLWWGMRHDTRPRSLLISDLALAVSFAVPGAIAWRLRPRSRTGLWMLLLGVVMLIETPYGFMLPRSAPGTDLIAIAGEPVFWLQFALAGQLLLSYPSGRLPGAAERRLVVIAYILAIAGSAVRMVVRSATADRNLYDVLRVALILVWICLAVAAMRLLFVRIARSRPRQRVAVAGAILGFLVFAIGFAILAYLGTDKDVGTVGVVYAGMAWAVVVAIPFTFLVGLLQEKLAFSSFSQLVHRFDHASAEAVEKVLGDALRDPAARIAFPVPDGLRDVHGRHLAPPVDPAMVVTPLGTSQTAVLIHDAALSDQDELLETVSSAARMALDNARLYAVLRSQLRELRDSRQRIASATDAERQLLERDLREGAQNRLLAIGQALGEMRAHLHDSAARVVVEELEHELRGAIAELREFARGLRPAVLADKGLARALACLIERVPVHVSLDAHITERFAPIVEATAYFVVSEALQNVVKHAAEADATVSASTVDGWLIVEVDDTGPGGARLPAGTGMIGLDDRVSAIGGRLVVHSPPGAGTRIRAELPIT